MNRIKREKQVAAIAALSEGCSVRSVERLTGIHRDTVLRLLVRVGDACARLMDDEMRSLPCRHVQLDEQWTFVGKKQRRLRPEDDESRMGDFWIWAGICADTRVVPAFRLGKRTAEDANAFVADLSGRMENRVEISSDGLSLYVEAVEQAFGGNVDFGQIVKSYEAEEIGPGRYSPPRVSTVERTTVVGDPQHVSTSYVERLNLLTRMRCRRLTRLVDSFSKKLENLEAALRLHFAVYNYVKRHRSLDGSTPAMAAGVSSELWEIADLVALAGW